MSPVAFSIITPTIRAHTLQRMLSQLVPQLTPEDETLVMGDGPQPKCRAVVDSFGSPCLKYWEMVPAMRDWGNSLRNNLIGKARGTHLVFIDDDDQIQEGGLEAMRTVVSATPDRPHMFRMFHNGNLIWGVRKVRVRNVSGQMFVPPNVPGRLGKWPRIYTSDFVFIKSTLERYPEGHDAVVWSEFAPIIQGLGGA